MLISYNSELLREICFQESSAIKYLGEEAATSLRARYSDLVAAENVTELPIGQVDINGNLCTLIFRDVLSIKMVPNYGAAPNGHEYDWSTVQRVKLVGVNDVE